MGKINMIRREGGSRILAVSSILPKAWIAVELKVIKQTKKIITVNIEKVK